MERLTSFTILIKFALILQTQTPSASVVAIQLLLMTLYIQFAAIYKILLSLVLVTQCISSL